MHIDELVEAQRGTIGDEDLEDGEVHTAGAQLVIGVSDRAEEFDAGLFEIGQIPAVVDDSHGIGLGEADPESVTERVVVGIEWRIDRGAHPPIVVADGVAVCGGDADLRDRPY